MSDITEEKLWETMMDSKVAFSGRFTQAFAVLKRDIVMRKWQGHGAKPEFVDVSVLAGSRVRVVMASRFGDVGITDDLKATSGYHYRTTCVPGEFGGKTFEAADLLAEIQWIDREAKS